uniref:Uncharacterized protein n=1 Tax=blood disease bacterium R229 TaxID=741978 RepID=G2ZX37_9RALS|nr:hypothetical protein BDB_mp70053 [blood disease bacterium R229]
MLGLLLVMCEGFGVAVSCLTRVRPKTRF